MDSVLKAIEALQRTPVPNLLIILGGVFLLLAFVGKIGATIEMPPGRQKLAGLVGALVSHRGDRGLLGPYIKAVCPQRTTGGDATDPMLQSPRPSKTPTG